MRKKMYLAVLLALVLLTGCGKKEKMTCTSEQTFGTAVLTTEMTVTFKKGYLESTETVMSIEFETEETAESFADTYRGRDGYTVNVDGTKVSVKNVDKVDGDSTEVKENKKDEVKDYLTERGFTCK